MDWQVVGEDCRLNQTGGERAADWIPSDSCLIMQMRRPSVYGWALNITGTGCLFLCRGTPECGVVFFSETLTVLVRCLWQRSGPAKTDIRLSGQEGV